jgi:hypothetical protein
LQIFCKKLSCSAQKTFVQKNMVHKTILFGNP